MADHSHGRNHDEDLAYGHLHDSEDEGNQRQRGFLGGAFNRFRNHHAGDASQQQTSQTSSAEAINSSSIGNPSVTQQYQPQLQNQTSPPVEQLSGHSQPKGSFMDSIIDNAHLAVHKLGSEVAQKVSDFDIHSHTHHGLPCAPGLHPKSEHRYGSFAGQRSGNGAKWFVDGCDYMWAISEALITAKESIWILDWWLTPELYLRRPPSKFEQYRLDRLLQAAAQRGVKVNCIVYKEITQALTRKYLTPILSDYFHSLLSQSANRLTSLLSRLGLAATFASLEQAEAHHPLMDPPLTVSSAHTKHALEALHPNIAVFRHPDHLPDAKVFQSSLVSSLQKLSLNAATASKLPGDALQAIYGVNEDVILYWAHHEKLCLVDGKIAFMGGLDLCFGRWDTNQHPIADAHPGDLQEIVYPGQDYNNARVMDFVAVDHPDDNKLDRSKASRMGWSDVSFCLSGPVVNDLKEHFADRWNFIYNEKYDVRSDSRYSRISIAHSDIGSIPHQAGGIPAEDHAFAPLNEISNTTTQSRGDSTSASQTQPAYIPPSARSAEGNSVLAPDESTGHAEQSPHGLSEVGRGRSFGHGGLRAALKEKAIWGMEHVQEEVRIHQGELQPPQGYQGSMACQIVRSCTKWSNGSPTEASLILTQSVKFSEVMAGLTSLKSSPLRQSYSKALRHPLLLAKARIQLKMQTQSRPAISRSHSIANAYISVIEHSQHFLYIENQFFITATSQSQKPIRNKIGGALVNRILKAAKAGEKYKVIVVMPSIPAFAGNLKDESSLGTRAIMEFQYDSINRGGHSIYERIAKEGFDPTEYIRFYNLRNYDRINTGRQMQETEEASGVSYEAARKEHDDQVGAGFGGRGEGTTAGVQGQGNQYQAYQAAAEELQKQYPNTGRWDSVSECYMLGGTDIRNVPWESSSGLEIDSFVSEELYVHSKIMIADDRIVLCGSANLNDRSQLGDHDSEIAVVVEDPVALDSFMDGRPWKASKFAATLRRQIFRKHLGLLPAENMQSPDANFQPIGVDNLYDLHSMEDQAVADPLSNNFLNLWNTRAKQNTDAFARVFHPVPYDGVKNWKDYDEYFGKYFAIQEHDGKKEPAKYEWGHVVKESFSEGEQGAKEVKEILSTVHGSLVEMPLLFLIEEDIAKEGVSLNAFTEQIYT